MKNILHKKLNQNRSKVRKDIFHTTTTKKKGKRDVISKTEILFFLTSESDAQSSFSSNSVLQHKNSVEKFHEYKIDRNQHRRRSVDKYNIL